LYVSAIRSHLVINNQLVSNSGAFEQLQHLPLAWPKKGNALQKPYAARFVCSSV